MRYAHTSIVARSWRVLAAFYTEVFGCQVRPPVREFRGEWLARGTGVPEAELEGIHLLLPGYGAGGPTLEIFAYGAIVDPGTPAPNQRGLAHLAFEVEDVRQTLRDVVAHGGGALGEITEHAVEGAGRVTFVYARDPEGNVLELQSWA